ncbi:MAG: MGMT family protein [Bacteroidetes bacterium]|nr:MGMT family protein [Bacteroidota bacterium]
MKKTPQKSTDKKTVEWMDRIYEIVRKIPKGRVSTYGAIADCIGMRTTSRMVGWAMNASHRITPKIPAHRVVNRNGVLTGKLHFETPTLMQELLESEGITIIDDQIQHFDQLFWHPKSLHSI